jgi:hypothetical protein
MRRAKPFTAAILLGALLCAPGARAQSEDDATRSAARMLGYSGIEAYQAGNYELASERLEQSFQLLHVPSLGLWSARALVKLGKLVEAHERYGTVAQLSSALGDAPVQQAAKSDALREGAELWPRIPRLTIEITGARPEDVVVTLDDVVLSRGRLALPLPVNPGQHRVTGRLGDVRAQVSVTLEEGQRERGVLVFHAGEHTPPPSAPVTRLPASASVAAEPSNGWTTAGWITLAVGAAGLTTGAVTYFVGKSKYDGLPAGCRDGGPCSESAAVDSYHTLRAVHTASTIGGAVLTGLGVTLLLVAQGSNEDVALQLGPGSAALAGRF